MAQSGLTKLARLLERRKKSIHKVLGIAGVAEIRKNFDKETDPNTGQKWAALSPVTLDRRRGSTAKILQDTGALRNAVGYVPYAEGLVFGLPRSYRYGETHQFGATKGQYGMMGNGTPIPTGDVPQRR